MLGWCHLQDVSANGARLIVHDLDLPANFVLMLSRNGRVWRRCKVVWREPDQIGVQFI